jgi:hypothetical protein
MRKLLAIMLLLPAIILTKCAWVRREHNMAAANLQRSLSAIPLPSGAQILEEKSEVGGFISGTGDAIDVLAYRVFVSDLPATTVFQAFAAWATQTPVDDVRGVFRLDTTETLESHVTELFLRQAISQPTKPTYVIYSAERIDDGVWDWRGW